MVEEWGEYKKDEGGAHCYREVERTSLDYIRSLRQFQTSVPKTFHYSPLSVYNRFN